MAVAQQDPPRAWSVEPPDGPHGPGAGARVAPLAAEVAVDDGAAVAARLQWHAHRVERVFDFNAALRIGLELTARCFCYAAASNGRAAAAGCTVGGGLFWFILGVIATLAFVNDWVDEGLAGVVAVAGGVITFLFQLGVVGGFLGALVLIGLSLIAGREWSERARGTYEADAAFKRRREHRG